MKTSSNAVTSALIVSLAVLISIAVPADHAFAEETASDATTAQSPASQDYVGDAVCLTCHEKLKPGLTEEYEKTIHFRVLNAKNGLTPLMQRGCEACHGPGGDHVRAGGGKGKGHMLDFEGHTPEAVRSENTACLQCHQGGQRLYWEGSTHPSRDVGCASCHSVMHKVSDRNQLARATVIDTCGGCHRLQKARQMRSAHMPVREGKMDCASCHNPHGTIADKLIAANTINDNCYQCHADKRGPYLWEHAPVRESCLTCHEPHGSTRNDMLKLGVPRLCQSCHIENRHPTQPHAPDERFILGQACLNCHPMIHGSNHPSGSAFTR